MSLFFDEWESRRTGETRSVGRAQDLADLLDLPDLGTPLLAVVGSKGKGTCATFASAYLAAAGLQVVTITSPGFRTHRERIRVNGGAVSERELSGLTDQLAMAVRRLPRRTPGSGYLSPSGLFMIAGLLHARSTAANVVVVEAGRGGLSDEISLFPADVVAITPIFGEHLGEIGDSLPDIARDKAGIITHRTRTVVASPQSSTVEPVLRTLIAERGTARPEFEVVARRSSGVPDHLLSTGLNRMNAEVGCVAARRLLDLVTGVTPEQERIVQVLATISLPARLSSHRLGEAEILVDSAIDRSGVSTALTVARQRWTGVDHAVVCLPDHKDLSGAIAEIGDIPVTFVRLPDEQLRFTRPLPGHWRVMHAGDLTRAELTSLGRRVVVLGTVYFTGRVLDLLDADTERLFEVDGH